MFSCLLFLESSFLSRVAVVPHVIVDMKPKLFDDFYTERKPLSQTRIQETLLKRSQGYQEGAAGKKGQILSLQNPSEVPHLQE